MLVEFRVEEVMQRGHLMQIPSDAIRNGDFLNSRFKKIQNMPAYEEEYFSHIGLLVPRVFPKRQAVHNHLHLYLAEGKITGAPSASMAVFPNDGPA